MDVEQGRIVSTLGAGDDALAEALTSVSTRLASRRDLPHGRDELVGVVSAAQALVNVATALQDSAIAGLAAVESAWAEDGTLVDLVRGPGHVALDTADLVAPSIGASHAQAQHRVDHAVRLAAGRIPVVDDPREVPRESGLTTLHDAMRDGRLDGYRAGVVAVELAEVPADVAETVVAALDPHLGVEPAPALRRRCRRLLARISPDLLRRRAERARRETGLRRWVAEPGVDAWWGTFPSEDAASAWAAIDELARQYVADGVCPGIDRARAKALTDLVTAHATVTTTVTLTVPAGGHAGLDGRTTDRDRCAGDGDLVEVRGLRPSEASLVSRAWVVGHLAPGGPAGAGPVPATLPCDPGSGALLDATVATAYRPPHRLAALVRRRDGRCRFPGCSVAARFCDLDHVRPWPTGPTAADNLACLCRRHHRIKQRAGWRVRMLPGALLEWTDPTGRVRTTQPIDALAVVVLAGPRGSVAVEEIGHGTSPAGPVEGEFSRLEYALEHLLASASTSPSSRATGAPARPAGVETCRTAQVRGLLVEAGAGPRPGCGTSRGRKRRSRWPDEPPF